MPTVQRVGDVNNAGAPITASPQTTVFVNGIKVAVQGSPVQAHSKKNSHRPVTTSSATVFVAGIAVTLTGDPDTCGHVRIGGSENVSAD
jgi:uncharacterized Zn-binding protein involved in type VI secretion